MHISENHLKEMGFTLNEVSAEESGSNAYHYYTWSLSQDSMFELISSESDNSKDDIWEVRIVNIEEIVISNLLDLTTLMQMVRDNTVKNNHL